MRNAIYTTMIAGLVATSFGILAPQASHADTYGYTYRTSSQTIEAPVSTPSTTTVIERTVESPVSIERIEEPVMIHRTVEKTLESPVIIEKRVERPVVIEKTVEKPVVVEKYIESPVLLNPSLKPMKIYRTKRTLSRPLMLETLRTSPTIIEVEELDLD